MCPGNYHDYSTMAGEIGVGEACLVWPMIPPSALNRRERGEIPRRTQRTSGWLIPGLICLNRLWQLERYAALVVLLTRSLHVQIPDGEFVPVSGREVEKRLAEDGVIRDLHRASVLENQKRRRQRRIRLDGGSLFPHRFGAGRGGRTFR